MKIYLTLILTCYNEGEHLKGSFKRIYSVLKSLKKTYEIIFIDDRSKDRTLEIIKGIIKEYSKRNVNIQLIEHRHNQGRGKSVMDGIGVSKGNITGFLDVDLEVGQEYILNALSQLETCDVVIGRRLFPFSFKTIHRYLASKIYAWMVRAVLNLPVHDSEAGFKFFQRNKIQKVLLYVRNNGWFWDTEIVALANLFKLKIKEIPVKYVRRTDKTSTVNIFKDSILYFWNLIEFRLRYKSIKK
ncbi:hypothetical protein A2954_00090 [Candidatus Roizmanbacteria bacterium RIFCSPLOWO2_01_FULL_37_12]|uniref:Glycosyltransferase 2-like domain-containing protein n=1 Tax=Candidatus Roizmanbacteria bacterium RIFCSPLOWO2_01_FULL_37_12 TaxID=1802056 RepID=A0A1F7IBE7_9BACT|nr:MAG: hypothetical protein A3D76_00415 [Candidatus Roizmanbacteria bacterium RIFCSPHIGHO2_02_FULL_37_9b]OGK40683.1 MAG: hypothetical protein A2954_00090 [Candidatus Roizmanbacteria bacterium RIFCSPLOWO2_01_FULL_37_12]